MGRCKKYRQCRWLDSEKIYKPMGIPLVNLEITNIAPDEFEALRLCDLENKSQIEAAAQMLISRGTVQRLLQAGRYKIINAILKSQAIKIQS
jgi:predicted DNA-binding protein (UPF0251 family)